MDISNLTDHERLVLGLRFRLKDIRLAIAAAEAGHVPDGFGFSGGETRQTMFTELRRLEAEVQTMLRDNGADETGRLN